MLCILNLKILWANVEYMRSADDRKHCVYTLLAPVFCFGRIILKIFTLFT